MNDRKPIPAVEEYVAKACIAFNDRCLGTTKGQEEMVHVCVAYQYPKYGRYWYRLLWDQRVQEWVFPAPLDFNEYRDTVYADLPVGGLLVQCHAAEIITHAFLVVGGLERVVNCYMVKGEGRLIIYLPDGQIVTKPDPHVVR